MKEKIKRFARMSLIKFYSLFHPVEKKILFRSFSGNQYSDNPRAISEKMHELYPEFKITWILWPKVSRDIIPSYVHIIDNMFDYYKELATCFCYVDNFAQFENIKASHKQFFVQTWHGDRAFKRILFDLNNNRPGVKEISDICIAGSTFGEKLYRSAFRFEGEILKTGSPRNDILFDNDTERKKKIKDSLGVSKRKKVVLFAPTFRDKSVGKQKANVDLEQVYRILNKNDDWICLVRAHAASKGIEFFCDGVNFLDVTDYPDMAELLLITDLLITDYSSSAFDIVLSHKPVILAAFDEYEYVSKSRTLYSPISETGFVVSYNQEELNRILENLDLEDYKKISDEIIKKYGMYEEGNASEKVCKRIKEEYDLRFGNSN